MEFVMKWRGVDRMVFVVWEVLGVCLLGFLLLGVMMCLLECVVSVGMLFWVIGFGVWIGDLRFEKLYGLDGGVEVGMKGMLKGERVELLVRVELGVLGEEEGVLGRDGDDDVVKGVDWGIVLGRDGWVWVMGKEDWFCVVWCLVVFWMCEGRVLLFLERVCEKLKSGI